MYYLFWTLIRSVRLECSEYICFVREFCSIAILHAVLETTWPSCASQPVLVFSFFKCSMWLNVWYILYQQSSLLFKSPSCVFCVAPCQKYPRPTAEPCQLSKLTFLRIQISWWSDAEPVVSLAHGPGNSVERCCKMRYGIWTGHSGIKFFFF